MFILQFFGIFILVILLFVVVFVGSLVFRMWDVVRIMMGKPPRRHSSFNVYTGPWSDAQTQQDNSHNSSSQSIQPTISGGKPRTSTIDKDEGEYVDYEVID